MYESAAVVVSVVDRRRRVTGDDDDDDDDTGTTDDAATTTTTSHHQHYTRPYHHHHQGPPKLFLFLLWNDNGGDGGGVDRTTILMVMSTAAAGGFWSLDRTWAGLLVSTATALGGPLIEVLLLTLSSSRDADLFLGGAGYHYTDSGETGFFPLWIVPVYFLGGPANGNLARGLWTWLGAVMDSRSPNTAAVTVDNKSRPGCTVCSDTRRVPCPNW